MSDPRYASYPYPAQGYYQGPYQGPPVMAPPQYQYGPPPPRRSPGFLEGWYACYHLLDNNLHRWGAWACSHQPPSFRSSANSDPVRSHQLFSVSWL
uniref:Cysteine-rich transmembrane CYSTM domain-containing protein n=1 Tax=Setaria italica TaxID=4555 RepID=K3ZYF5_SETIT